MGTVPIWAEKESTMTRHMYRPTGLRGSYISSIMGVSTTMKKTALKESWKLMSNSEEGCAASMMTAAIPSEFSADVSRSTARHTATMENIMSVRVMETGRPMT